MRIAYLSLSYVPSRRASSVHVMKMSAALARRGHRVTLLTKRCAARQEPGVADDFAFYGVEPEFRVAKLPRPGWKGGGLVWLAAVGAWLAQRRDELDLVYARDLVGGWLAARLGLRVIFEAHGPPVGAPARFLFRGLLGSPSFARLVVISAALLARLRAGGVVGPATPLRVEHDAADPAPGAVERPLRLAPPPASRAAAARAPRPRMGYVGHLYAGRGIELILDLARRLPGFDLHIYGGSEEDLARWRPLAPPGNVVFHGFVEPARLPAIYADLDLLLMPYQPSLRTASGRTDTASWMSPMKMFEYMAAGRPIVSSDLPVLREVLEHERNALLVPPAEVAAWVAAVKRLLHDPRLAETLARQAAADLAARHSWDGRAARVLEGA